jgi:hypothetical protein
MPVGDHVVVDEAGFCVNIGKKLDHSGDIGLLSAEILG